jgi:hypothetical protein
MRAQKVTRFILGWMRAELMVAALAVAWYAVSAMISA